MTDNELHINPLACDAAQAYLQRWDADTLRLARIIEAAFEKQCAYHAQRAREIGYEMHNQRGHLGCDFSDRTGEMIAEAIEGSEG